MVTPAGAAPAVPRPGSVPAGLFALDDVDGVVQAMRRHYVDSAARAAREGLGATVVPTEAQLRADVLALVNGQVAAPQKLDPLDESTDTIESATENATDAAGVCVSTLYAEGRKIFGLPIFRHVRLDGAHQCYGARILLCFTKAWVPSNQPLLLGIGVSDSGGCFNRTNNSGFTSKPTVIVGATTLLVEANERIGVGFVPFFMRFG